MPGFILFTMVVIITVIVWLFVHDAKRARSSAPTPPRGPASVPARPVAPRVDEPVESVDVPELAGHVRQLRRAVDEGLIGREEAIGSIVRQADGKVGEGAAERLLDSAELD